MYKFESAASEYIRKFVRIVRTVINTEFFKYQYELYEGKGLNIFKQSNRNVDMSLDRILLINKLLCGQYCTGAPCP